MIYKLVFYTDVMHYGLLQMIIKLKKTQTITIYKYR